jgi:hypothetical protein
MAKNNFIMDINLSEFAEMLWDAFKQQYYPNSKAPYDNMLNFVMKRHFEPVLRNVIIKYKMKHQDLIKPSKRNIRYINIYKGKIGETGIKYIYATEDDAKASCGPDAKTVKITWED